MSKEAMKLALEALQESLGYVQEEAENAQRLYGQYPARQARIQGLKDDARKHMDAITALREALAEQPAQQPTNCRHCGGAANVICAGQCKKQPAQQQEPVARCMEHGECFGGECIYTSPPASKPLTDEEIEALLPEPDGTAEVDSVRVLVAPGLYGTEYTEADAWTKESIIQVARAIEAAHGIKGDA